jgi:hypothetical protein
MIAQPIIRDDQSEALPSSVVYGEGPHTVEVIEGPNQGMILRFTTTILIGRTSRCNLVIESGGVAQEHARVELRYDRWTVANLNPDMVTLKNGSPIQVAGAASNDILTIGPTRLRLSFDASADRRRDLANLSFFGRHKRLLVVGLGLLILVPLVFLTVFRTMHRETRLQQQWAKELVADDTQDMCRLSTLLFQARRLVDTGHDEEAKERLRSILRLECGNEEAQRLLDTIQDKENSQANLTRQRALRTARTREAVQPSLREAEMHLAAGDIAGTRSALGAALAIDPDLPEAADILFNIEIREKAAQQVAQKQANTVLVHQEQLTALRDEAAADLANGAKFKAIRAYRQILQMETAPARQAEIRKKIAALQKSLSD